MATDDTLASVGAKITDIFTKTFGSTNPNASLVFLPFSVTPPEGLIQPKSTTDATPVVNAARMAAFLAENFDEPYLMSVDEGTIHGKDGHYGRISQIYPVAVQLAQPTHEVGSSAWKAVNAERSMAESVLGPSGASGMAYGMAASPDDWVLPSNKDYWSVFDSTQTQAPAASAASPAPSPAPRLWQFKAAPVQAVASPVLETLHAACPPQPAPDLPSAKTAPVLAREALVVRPALTLAQAENAPAVAPTQHLAVALAQRRTIAEAAAPANTPQAAAASFQPHRFLGPIVLPSLSPPPPPAPPPSSNLSMHFEYMSVAIGYFNAGISMWNGVFVANPNWCVPGMSRGGLLPSPSIVTVEGQAPLSYGIPVALIVVRNLNISVSWSGQDQAALPSSGGFIGPFSLAGAPPAALRDGAYTYTRPGIQVIALLCERLPVLPPQDAPDVAAAPAPSDGSATVAGGGSAPAPASAGTAAASGAGQPAPGAGAQPA